MGGTISLHKIWAVIWGDAIFLLSLVCLADFMEISYMVGRSHHIKQDFHPISLCK